jgi:DNA-binding MarR family transcriptional regulator
MPIGLVAKARREKRGADTVLVYKITDAGKRYGVPTALLAIDWMSKNMTSMYNIFSTTHTHGETRAPYNVYRILKLLNENEFLRQVDLYSKMGISSGSIFAHCTRLSETGLIEVETGTATYKIIKHEYGDVWHKEKIESILKGKDEITTRDISDGGYSNKSFSYVIGELLEKGIIERTKWKSDEKMTEVRITELGKKFVNEFIEPLESLLSNETVTLPRIDKNDISIAMRVAKESSACYNRKSSVLRKGDVESIVYNFVIGIPAKDVAAQSNTSYPTAYSILNMLCEERRIARVKEKGKYYYYPPIVLVDS